MQKKKKASSRLTAYIMVIAMVVTLTSTFMFFNADAVNSSMTVDDHRVFNVTSGLPGTLEPGQVATAKNVSDTDGAHGQFTVTYSAVGGELGSAPLISPNGIKFTDAFESEYAFFASSPTEMKIYIDSIEKTALLDSGKYVYSENSGSDPATLIKVTVDPVNNTLEYIIGADRLHLTSGPVTSGTPINTLSFDVRLLETIITADMFDTNLKDSCEAEFDALQSNSYYYEDSIELSYSNADRTPLPVWACAGFYEPWHIENFNEVRLLLADDPYTNNYYQFMNSGGHTHINNTPDTDLADDQYWYGISLDAGIYEGNLRPTKPYNPALNNNIIEVVDPGISFTVHFDVPNKMTYNIDNSFTIYRLTPKPTPEFTVITPLPTALGDTCSVDVGGENYTGACTYWDNSNHWSFEADGYTITLLDKYDLTLEYFGSGWINTTDNSYVRQTHDAYGRVVLIKQDIVTGSLTIAKRVTEGASTSEEFGITVAFSPGVTVDISGISPPAGATFDSGKYTLSLSADDGPVTFTDIPVGTSYSVTESITTAQEDAGWSGPADAATGTISEGEANVIISNIFDTLTPSLTITKNVSPGASINEKFSITVAFTPDGTSDISGITPPAGTTGASGTYTLLISANDGPVTFSDIPVGTTYSVTENITDAQKQAGWTGPTNAATGTISKDGASVIISNTYDAPSPPPPSPTPPSPTPPSPTPPSPTPPSPTPPDPTPPSPTSSPETDIAGDVDKPSEPPDDTGVAGEYEKLPQTGGISSSTFAGLIGLSILFIGGVIYVIVYKKEHSR